VVKTQVIGFSRARPMARDQGSSSISKRMPLRRMISFT
jgi:hypothetical protein